MSGLPGENLTVVLLPEAEVEWVCDGGQGDGKWKVMSCYSEDQVSGLALGAPLNHSESPFPYSAKRVQ